MRLTLAALLLTVLAACGGGSSSDGSDPLGALLGDTIHAYDGDDDPDYGEAYEDCNTDK